MNDRVIKAYLALFDSSLRIPYMEKKTTVNEQTVIASVYKSTKPDTFYCVAVIINNGEYLFEDVASYSRYYTSDEVMSKDIAQETLSLITQQLLFRKRLLTFISDNPKLPSVLSAAYNKNLIIYYSLEGKLRTAELHMGELILNLPPKEQVYITDLLAEFKITVRRAPLEVGYRNGY